jgi:hypothetical protein
MVKPERRQTRRMRERKGEGLKSVWWSEEYIGLVSEL